MTKALTVLSLLLVALITKAQAQHDCYKNPIQIDSVIAVKTVAYSKEYHTQPVVLDGPGTYSEFTKYKKVIGIKVRIAKGHSEGGDIMLDREPFYYYATYVINKNAFLINEYDTVYFINNKPVKSVRIIRKDYKNEDKHILQHKEILYFKNDVVIDSEIDGKVVIFNGKKLIYLVKYIHSREEDMLTDQKRNER
jgi:hypothetical protein